MTSRRLALLVTAVMVVLVAAASPVSAAVGDTVDDPIVISGALPITVATDTTSATSDPTDPDVWCGPLRPNATTFYSYTPSVPTYLTFVGDDRGRAAVYAVDGGGNLQNLGCVIGGVTVTLSPGQPYIVMVFECCDPGDPGGLGTLGLRAVPPPLEADLNVTSTVLIRPPGDVARVSGTYNCNTPADFGGNGSLYQRRGSLANELIGWFFLNMACDESGHGSWSVDVPIPGGAPSSGTARLTIDWGAVSWNEQTQDGGLIDMTVRLAPTRG